jgi:hypothetical protein
MDGEVWEMDGEVTGGALLACPLRALRLCSILPCYPFLFCLNNLLINTDKIYIILQWRHIVYCLIKCFQKILGNTVILQI